MNAPLTAGRLRELLHYNPDTGAFGRLARSRNVRVLSDIGHAHGSGYVVICVDGIHYHAHRLAWLYVFGEWPANEIDHIDGMRSNNRIANLRDVTKSVNQQNLRGAKRHNKSGYLGVKKKGGIYQARIKINGKEVHLGCHRTPQLASEAYLKAKREMHEGNTL